eukprot:TRINITY_DN2358_c0_g1_i1.p1 TRINITY_DN2358_c0_g1~~TRINITY_DN2358_c0_g1_i1.p1  ORF type:complete len:652 (-),score=162.10 TRINITY_DN2358_c0_g1_i1:934-2889(-)
MASAPTFKRLFFVSIVFPLLCTATFQFSDCKKNTLEVEVSLEFRLESEGPVTYEECTSGSATETRTLPTKDFACDSIITFQRGYELEFYMVNGSKIAPQEYEFNVIANSSTNVVTVLLSNGNFVGTCDLTATKGTCTWCFGDVGCTDEECTYAVTFKVSEPFWTSNTGYIAIGCLAGGGCILSVGITIACFCCCSRKGKSRDEERPPPKKQTRSQPASSTNLRLSNQSASASASSTNLRLSNQSPSASSARLDSPPQPKKGTVSNANTSSIRGSAPPNRANPASPGNRDTISVTRKTEDIPMQTMPPSGSSVKYNNTANDGYTQLPNRPYVPVQPQGTGTGSYLYNTGETDPGYTDMPGGFVSMPPGKKLEYTDMPGRNDGSFVSYPPGHPNNNDGLRYMNTGGNYGNTVPVSGEYTSPTSGDPRYGSGSTISTKPGNKGTLTPGNKGTLTGNKGTMTPGNTDYGTMPMPKNPNSPNTSSTDLSDSTNYKPVPNRNSTKPDGEYGSMPTPVSSGKDVPPPPPPSGGNAPTSEYGTMPHSQSPVSPKKNTMTREMQNQYSGMPGRTPQTSEYGTMPMPHSASQESVPPPPPSSGNAPSGEYGMMPATSPVVARQGTMTRHLEMEGEYARMPADRAPVKSNNPGEYGQMPQMK